jgi:general secretion pathway protein G
MMTRSRCCRGFTLMELMLVVAIIGILGGAAIPSYLGYLDKARIARSIAEIRHIDKSIQLFYATSEAYPMSLADVGVDNIRDPWGMPYQYLNLISFAATKPLHPLAVTHGETFNPWSWFAPSTAHATPPAGRGNANAGSDNRGKGKQGGNSQPGQGTAGSSGNAGGSSLPTAAASSPRKDRFGVPINSDYDLYSMGKNRETMDSLTTPKSYDDIVRASDGMFVGLASDF